MAIELPKLKQVDFNKPKKKKIFLLSDDMRLHSGVGTMSKELVFNTCDKYDWVQLGGAIKHPDQGKRFDMSADVQKETGVKDASVTVYPCDGYGNPDLVRQLIKIEKPDAIMHFTDPRFWGWLYNMEHEIRQEMPLLYLNIWDDLPYPHWNENFYETCDLLMGISKQTVNINRNVCQRKPRTSWDLTYVPHGIDDSKFYPIDVNHGEFSKMFDFKTNLFGTENHPEFIAFFNSRNIRRKNVSGLILSYKLFCDKLPKEDAANCCLLLHTDRVDQNGTDLPAVVNALCPDYTVKFTDKKFPTNELNYLYNISNVTCQPSSAEGFGLSICESLMTGTPIIATCIGGLQDQMGFKKEDGSYLTVDDYTTDFPSNSNLKYTEHGEWAFPLKANLSLQGSPPTPYIYDSSPNLEQLRDRLKEVYDLGYTETSRRGLSGREYVMTKEIGMTSKLMGENFIDSVETMWKHWKPRKRFSVIDTKELNIKYPAGTILE
jgi:glycosyltransferase involved in cell wall biosynthesis